MKKFLKNQRSRYLIAIGLLAIGVGVISKKFIIYPTGCSTKQEVTFAPLLP
tara:strand:- start:4170 stop:4322 length:153 start_codon:yes stop_codon:yes gene_type:complete